MGEGVGSVPRGRRETGERKRAPARRSAARGEGRGRQRLPGVRHRRQRGDGALTGGPGPHSAGCGLNSVLNRFKNI
jgi:hypothetical protein